MSLIETIQVSVWEEGKRQETEVSGRETARLWQNTTLQSSGGRLGLGELSVQGAQRRGQPV